MIIINFESFLKLNAIIFTKILHLGSLFQKLLCYTRSYGIVKKFPAFFTSWSVADTFNFNFKFLKSFIVLFVCNSGRIVIESNYKISINIDDVKTNRQFSYSMSDYKYFVTNVVINNIYTVIETQNIDEECDQWSADYWKNRTKLLIRKLRHFYFILKLRWLSGGKPFCVLLVY